MGYMYGRNCKIQIGTTAVTITGQGTWSLNGVSADEIDTTAFGTIWKTFQLGMIDGGTVEFSGLFDPMDYSGQIAMMMANIAATEITHLKLFYHNSGYWVPNQTASYFCSYGTTGWGSVGFATPVSFVVCKGFSVTADKSGAVQVSFSAKVSGCMVMVHTATLLT